MIIMILFRFGHLEQRERVKSIFFFSETRHHRARGAETLVERHEKPILGECYLQIKKSYLSLRNRNYRINNTSEVLK
jgi:hypothetical protein